MQVFIRTVRKITHDDVVSSGILVDESNNKLSREWTKQSFTTLEDATEAYMVELIAESHM